MRGRRLAAAVTALALSACAPRPHAAPPGDFLLISIDTLRADHLGCYGYRAPTTPNLDRFRRDAVLFTSAIAQAPSTLVSHASIFTSLLPQQHGAAHGDHIGLPAAAPTLAEELRRRGARTVSFNEGGQVGQEFGLARGFERYHSTFEYRFADVVEQTLRWLGDRAPSSLFLFLHTYEVHHPYKPEPRYLAAIEPQGYSGPLPKEATYMANLIDINEGRQTIGPRDLQHVVATYDAEVRSMDEAFGRLIDDLKRRGLYDRTLIVFTSDHGEEFGEHGKVGWHSHTLYDELLRVPLLIKYPRSEHASATVAQQVRSIDIAPTALAVLGVPIPPSFRGSDLTPLVLGRPEPIRFAVSRRDSSAVSSIRMPRWKLFDGRLFDLERDPKETTDVAREHPDVVEKLALREQALVAERPPLVGKAVELSEEAKARLRALGYVQ
ncbi:MAG TPA: sulfatase [Thermoanaerobaculia bacterium]